MNSVFTVQETIVQEMSVPVTSSMTFFFKLDELNVCLDPSRALKI